MGEDLSAPGFAAPDFWPSFFFVAIASPNLPLITI
jgi:hypothetical protein